MREKKMQTQIISYSDVVAAQLAKPVAPLTHKEMAAHIRKRIKVAGIKARVQMREACGDQYIQVFGVTFDAEFTDQEQREIRQIAKTNGLTLAQGMEIDVEQMTNSKTFEFVFHGSKHAY
jgi:hypothetical protein